MAPPPPAQTGAHNYTAEAGQSLKMVLEQWSDEAGVDLVWSSIVDYSLPRSIHMTGTFADAVKAALLSYQDNAERPIGTLHTNTAKGAPVLEIKNFQSAQS
jgi:hypothetical protein